MARPAGHHRSVTGGFTLLELLVAMALLALMSVMAFAGLDSVLGGEEQNRLAADRLGRLELGFSLIGRDLEQAAEREVRDAFGDPLPAMRGGGTGTVPLEFTQAGWVNPMGQPRAHLQRVELRLEEDRLVRRAWRVLDRVADSEAAERILFGGVRGLRLRFLDGADQWQDAWPPLGNDKASPLPRAVEVTVELEDWGEIPRLFLVPGAGGGEAPAGGSP